MISRETANISFNILGLTRFEFYHTPGEHTNH